MKGWRRNEKKERGRTCFFKETRKKEREAAWAREYEYIG